MILIVDDDPSVTAFARIRGDGSLRDFARLKLEPNADKMVQAYLDAKPGDVLNLSREEIAAFDALDKGQGSARDRVEEVASGRRLSDRQRGWQGHLQGEGVELVPARANPRGVLGDAPRVHRGRVHADEDVGAVPGVGGGGALRR